MITLLPWMCAAFGSVTADSIEYNRLLGSSDAVEMTRVEPKSAPESGVDASLAERPVGPSFDVVGTLWPAGALLALAGIGVFVRRKVQPQRTQPVRVVSSTALGSQGTLSVVEVQAADGSWQRLLVGSGGGSPSLVSRLGRTDFSGSPPRRGASECAAGAF